MEKLEASVLALVAEAPLHCHDVADELGISMKTASAVLSALHSDGLLVRRFKTKPAGVNRLCWVYQRPNLHA
jgi:predicted transcriptional regulator